MRRAKKLPPLEQGLLDTVRGGSNSPSYQYPLGANGRAGVMLTPWPAGQGGASNPVKKN